MAQPVRHIEPAPHWDLDEENVLDNVPGPTFKLGGEEFHCMAVPPLGVLPRMWAAGRVDDRGRQVIDTPDVINFIEDVLCVELPTITTRQPLDEAGDVDGNADPIEVEELQPCDDVMRWRILCGDKSRPIDAQVVGELVGKLLTFYGQRPTRASGR